MVQKVAGDWKYDVVSIGYPGPVLQHRPVAEPPNLAPGWVGFGFEEAFGCPVKVLGSYKGGKMLFLGLGTGFGSAMVVEGVVEPMELGHLPYRRATYEHYVGLRGLEKYGKKKWQRYVKDVVARLITALEPEDVVLGGGNMKELEELPDGCRAGDNANAFLGGFRMWQAPADRGPSTPRQGSLLMTEEKPREDEHGNTRPNGHQKPRHRTIDQTQGPEGSASSL
jgi:polyphosphate glucokinase